MAPLDCAKVERRVNGTQLANARRLEGSRDRAIGGALSVGPLSRRCRRCSRPGESGALICASAGAKRVPRRVTSCVRRPDR